MKNQTYRMTMLFDFYGEVLTPRQKEFFDLYYNEDLSLAEIAENYGISRQGVRDVIVRAEAIMTDLEDKTGLMKRFLQMQQQVQAILDAAKAALEGVTEWTAANIDAALEPLPEQMDLKKRVVFQAVRVAVCGNMVSPPLGETMALVGRDDCLARIDRARTMAL